MKPNCGLKIESTPYITSVGPENQNQNLVDVGLVLLPPLIALMGLDWIG